ncbi:MAG: hypothetical protein WCJ25_02025 [Candidatus Moraniibacteriota bacterium]
MTEKKHGTPEPIPDVEVTVTEISVARNRAVEPYIKTFAFSPENVTQETLGTLVGAFSISDRSESSAYTVNVIASVARKEYYANPRRGSVESFESTLHRINLALSELVKNGQTSWMGSLHGTIAVVEKGNIHFSATGDGKILLFRDGSLLDISDGLASEEAAHHPLKTFLEISSGQLSARDCVLLATPEPLGLFSPRDLERDANRLLPERKFVRFLETAMINDLRTGAIVVLDAREAVRIKESEAEEKPKRKRAVKPEPVNAWSEVTFRKAAEERTKVVLDAYDLEETSVVPEPDESVPPSSTEIRIQGEALENADEHPAITKLRWMYEDTMHSFRKSVSRPRRKEVEVSDPIPTANPNIASSTESARDHRKENQEEPESQGAISFSKRRPTEPPPSATQPTVTESSVYEDLNTSARRPHDLPIRILSSERAPASLPATDTLARQLSGITDRSAVIFTAVMKTTRRLLSVYAIPAIRSAYRLLRRVSIIVARRIGQLAVASWKRFLSLTPKRQLIIAAGIAFLFTVVGTIVWKNIPRPVPPPPAPVVIETPVVEPFPPAGEKNASLATVSPLPATDQDLVTPVYLGNSLYLVTKSGIVDTAKNTSSPLPTPSLVRLASGMNDLGLIFLLTDHGDLYSFAPSNHAFVKNTIPLPTGFRATSMGDYLTYLYFLEDGTGKIYRFPRAEGGFGDGTLWTKSPMPSGTRAIAVSDAISGTDGSTMTSFLKGKPTAGFSFEKPVTPLTITAICANADLSDRVVILDAPAKRVIIQSGSGAIISQLFDESFFSATTCAVSQDGSSVAVSGGTSASTITIKR